MKRSEMLKKIQDIIIDAKIESNDMPLHVCRLALDILDAVELAGMVKCEKRDLGAIGRLWTPEGWESEDGEVQPSNLSSEPTTVKRSTTGCQCDQPSDMGWLDSMMNGECGNCGKRIDYSTK